MVPVSLLSSSVFEQKYNTKYNDEIVRKPERNISEGQQNNTWFVHLPRERISNDFCQSSDPISLGMEPVNWLFTSVLRKIV